MSAQHSAQQNSAAAGAEKPQSTGAKAVADNSSIVTTDVHNEPDTTDSGDAQLADIKDPEARVLSGYHQLQSRRVDLIGDYAGDEIFFIEGDSILRRCLDDEKLDLTTGCQLLHAAYSVENFLNHLIKRKCNFHIVFFDTNRQLALPPGVPKEKESRYYLARAAVIRHLRINVAKSHPTLVVKNFESWDSAAFVEYLVRISPYFLMAHDGARTADRKTGLSETSHSPTPRAHRVALRTMILSFVKRGFNVALVNGLEWRDTKVMTMVLEARLKTAILTLPAKEDCETLTTRLPSVDVSSDMEKLIASDHTFTERQILAILAVGKMLQSSDPGTLSPEQSQRCAAFLLHEALLAHLPLSTRRVAVHSENTNSQMFISALSEIAESILNSWEAAPLGQGTECDVVDFIDGRLYLSILQQKPSVSAEVKSLLDSLLEAVQGLVHITPPSIDVASGGNPGQSESATSPPAKKDKTLAVLPFSNSVFDKHLQSVHLKIDSTPEGPRTLAARKVFQEVTHWQKAKRPIIQKSVSAPATAKEAKDKFWADKRNQLFMAEMRTYAASLTNAVGKSLEPDSIVVRGSKQKAMPAADSDASDSASSAKGRGKGGAKKAGGKTAALNVGKKAMLGSIAAGNARKNESAGDKVAAAWSTACKGFEADSDPRAKYRKAKVYLANMQQAWKVTVGTECELYMLNCLLQYWIDACRRKEQQQRIQVAALIWNHARSIARLGPLAKSIANSLVLVVDTLKLPPLPTFTESTSDRKLAFKFALPTKVEGLAVQLPSKEFQLLECGPYLERSFDSRPDSRVDFQPDGWQRKVLDTIDADKSAFVVAPTSAGKTFISFYAMRKILYADDEGVLVYVAPTKALVNQIAAEIQARYSKKFKYGGKSVWAIHTRDYRINSPTGCQVLVTVPHVLQIMLLAPSHANSWSTRVKRIIFDEIHSIGQAEDGVVWEQLLLMAPCPIIALSATVGNPEEFSSWLATTQEAIGKELVTVQHPFRYSDLRKYYYVPPRKFGFYGIPERKAFGSLGLEGLTGFNFVHPVAALVDKSRGIPEDLALEPRDCFSLWQAMVRVQTEQYSVPAKLDPAKALPEVSRKVDILEWEKDLKTLLGFWLADPSSPYDQLLHELEQSFRKHEPEEVYSTVPENKTATVELGTDEDSTTDSTLALLCRLQEQDALPAIFFNYDRHACEKICRSVVEELQASELTQVKSGVKWERTLQRFEEYRAFQAKAAAKKASSKKAKNTQEDEKMSKLDAQRDDGESDSTKWDSFDPAAPAEGYHLADHSKLQTSDLEVYTHQLRRRDVPQWLIDALWRGIGVHHAGMNRKYRQVVEILFRKGFLRVIIATGTLALGINMPCKTVVFSGDSVFLTALNYRQCAGRAGRRGFDLLGNVVFQGITPQKVCRLISSRLPDLNGHFPITTTLVLRLFTLLHESKNARYAVSAINALLSQPRLYMGGASFKDQTMHHLRFSIEYLRRQQLLGSNGAPLNFAGLVSHLYFTENSSFAFHALLKEGYFHELCANIDKNEKDTLETMMLILSHLFNRVPCRQADEEFREKVVKPSSSIVFLPPMPKTASDILLEHNKQTLSVFRAYVQTFVDQHIKEDDRRLPLSGIQAGAEAGTTIASIESLPPARIRSSFVALSGAGDDFDTIHDLCQTTRDGVFLEEAVIPHMEVYPEEMEVPLNAYLLDFYKHGDVHTIERANRIRRSEIWFVLNDFSLVLATIITSLMNFMKLNDATDLDMLEVMGNMDAHEEAVDDKVAATETQSEVSGPSVADSAVVLTDRTKAMPNAPTKRQAKNADSWEDLAGSDDEVDEVLEKQMGAEAKALAEELAAWDGGGGEGLKDVLKAFQKLHADFTVKFKAMWA